MRKRLSLLMLSVAAVMPAVGGPIVVNLNTASSFGLLGGTISNTGLSVVMGGNVGAQTTITGFPPGTATGTIFPFPSDPTVVQAYNDFVNAFDAAMLLSSSQFYPDLTVDRTFVGNNVYTFGQTNISTTTGINLTFDAQNDPTEIFVLRTDGAFTANGALTFTLQNQAQADHIFWIIGTTATLSPGSAPPMTFDGDFLVGQSFTMSARAGGSGVLAGTINGCVFAETEYFSRHYERKRLQRHCQRARTGIVRTEPRVSAGHLGMAKILDVPIRTTDCVSH